ncbi:unnamed protein product [Diatraea saccharalis]|uniref:Glycinamide ribonucleotide synthetase n=1 Tax=Diatraea saccharalis TaxID=40085 RepID=A0A9N9QZL9_9NEOP|nr:unnamed protein product [Diatraea saccharalis]
MRCREIRVYLSLICRAKLFSYMSSEIILQQHAINYIMKGKIIFTFSGVLYAGLMITKSGPMTLEFNCRFGDPETQVLMTLLESDLYTVMNACVDGTLNKLQVAWNTKLSAVGVVIASKGYPETSTKGCVISGLSQVQSTPGLVVFYSGVSRGANGSLVSWGGRVVLACARAGSLRAAAAAATAAASVIDFPGAHYRKDIAHRAFSK